MAGKLEKNEDLIYDLGLHCLHRPVSQNDYILFAVYMDMHSASYATFMLTITNEPSIKKERNECIHLLIHF